MARSRILGLGKRFLRSVFHLRLAGHEPAPTAPFALRVGVTGNLQIDEPNVLKQNATEVVARIREALQTCASKLDPAGGLPVQLKLIASLAAGADQIVARAAVEQGYQIHAVLPSGAIEFATDIAVNVLQTYAGDPENQENYVVQAVGEFATLCDCSATRLELSEAAAPLREEDYRLAGEAVLANSDILIAAIRPGASHGLSVGLIRLALECGIPVIRIPLDGSEVHIVTAADNRNGERRVAFPCRIDEVVSTLVHPKMPVARPENLVHRSIAWFENRLARTYSPQYSNREWLRIWGSPPLCEHSYVQHARSVIDTIFRPAAVWADRQAAAFAGLYRGAFALNAMLGVIAVALALTGGVFHEIGVWTKSAELLLLALMSGIFLVARERRWRGKWLEARALYQETHNHIWRYLLGQTSPRRARRFRFAGGSGHSMLAAMTRAAGVAWGNAGFEYLDSVRAQLLHGFIQRQHTYFESESEGHHELDEKFERRTEACIVTAFFFTAFALALILLSRVPLLDFLEPVAEPVATGAMVAGALLPACAAALVAVSTFEEHNQFAARYREMASVLGRVRTAMASLCHPDEVPAWSPRALTRQALSDLLYAAIDAADEELVHWKLVLSGKSIDRF
jgi:hypothetical protein